MITLRKVEDLQHGDDVLNLGVVKGLTHDILNNRVEVVFDWEKPCTVVNNPFEPRVIFKKGSTLTITLHF